ncbi:MAG: hypothetical protein A2X36_11430 [Elusimicrobia bacterium GWA2_69_24]|nr:MAG: hypothetical protein A2X36_11430 [Elusimicrobia bacterium GWA2_69_24]HBL18009.1 hypothetical protein [Elusimicrobiota bacterium]
MALVVLLILLCFLVSFSCSVLEATFYSVSRARIETLKRQGDRRGALLADLRDRMDEPITAILLVNTLVNTGGATWIGVLVGDRFHSDLVGFFSAGMTLGILLVGEIIPKTLGTKYANRLAPYCAWPLRAMVWTFWPLVKLLTAITGMFGRHPHIVAVPKDDIISLATMSLQGGVLRAQEARWIVNALHLDRLRTDDIMTPASVVRRVPDALPLSMTKVDADHWRFSRIPVCRDDAPDRIVGVVQRRDVYLSLLAGNDALTMRDLMHPPVFIADSLPAHDLLNLFIQKKQHLFCVRDGQGRWIGVVTLEDVLEALLGTEIVGEQDLYDDMQEAVREVEQAEALARDVRQGGGLIAHVTADPASPLIGQEIRGCGLPRQVVIGTLIRRGAVIVPRGDVRLRAGDRVALIGTKEAVAEAKARLSPPA